MNPTLVIIAAIFGAVVLVYRSRDAAELNASGIRLRMRL